MEETKRTPRTEPNIHKNPKRRTADDRGNRKSQRIYTANNNRNTSPANTNTMRIYKHLMAIALIALAATAATETAQAQEQENYVWITNTNGITWKRTLSTRSSTMVFSDSEKPEAAQIVVPEHASIDQIDMRGCINLTNLIFRPPTARRYRSGGYAHLRGWIDASYLTIKASGSGLCTITMQPHMIRQTHMEKGTSNDTIPAWLLTLKWTTNWQEGDPPKMEIRTITTNNGDEVEVIWRAGTLQIADALNGNWRDLSGSSPYRIPLASAKDMQFFRIKPEE